MLKCTRVYTVQFLKYLSLGISRRVECNHSARAKDISLTGLLLQLLSYVLQRWVLKHVIQPMHWSLGKGSGWPSSSLPHHNPLPGTEWEDERTLAIQFPGPTPDILNPKPAMDPALSSLTALQVVLRHNQVWEPQLPAKEPITGMRVNGGRKKRLRQWRIKFMIE